jgi:tRNA pseudouridine55 synthase
MTGAPLDPSGGVLLVDKPAGVTSFAVVNAVRKTLVRAYPDLVPQRQAAGGPRPPRFKCGHAGTLDPLATGLLVVLVGKASRLSHFLLGLDKTYAATVVFGTATDSLDADGEVVATAPVPADPAVLAAVLDRFRGEISQVPPVISALKQDGQPLYKLVRAGKDVVVPAARTVTIDRLELTAVRWAGPARAADFVVGCSSGTYIRSLARDIAAAAGTVGHIGALRRLAIGPFAVGDAVTGVMTMNGAELAGHLRPAAAALPHVPSLTVTDDEAARLRQGGQPLPAWLDRLDGPPVAVGKSDPLFCMLDGMGRLVAVGRLEPGTNTPSLAMGIPAPEVTNCD